MEADFNNTANKFGFKSVHELKKTIAYKIKQYVIKKVKIVKEKFVRIL